MRTVKQLLHAVASLGAVVDTGVLDVEEFHTLGVIVTVTGGASGLVSCYYIDEAGNAVLYQTGNAIPIGSLLTFSIGREAGGGAYFPVPRRWRFSAVSNAAGAVQLDIFGVADEPDNL